MIFLILFCTTSQRVDMGFVPKFYFYKVKISFFYVKIVTSEVFLMWVYLHWTLGVLLNASSPKPQKPEGVLRHFRLLMRKDVAVLI